jgi:pimeloyl-ACP methyl ester carboxylesterase
MASLARSLSHEFRVVEPFQRGSGGEALTVARHIADLAEVLEGLGGARPVLVGSSWGAMLALAYAATHPETVAGLVLIGCGTFDETARGEYTRELQRRMGDSLRREFERLDREVEDADERLRAKANLLLPLYCHDAEMAELENEIVDAAAHEESWADMLRLQREGIYPQQFLKIPSPVLMLHGTQDPHPGQAIRRGLEKYLPQLKYREWEGCGHYPWVERKVKDEFLVVLIRWLKEVTSAWAGGSKA